MFLDELRGENGYLDGKQLNKCLTFNNQEIKLKIDVTVPFSYGDEVKVPQESMDALQWYMDNVYYITPFRPLGLRVKFINCEVYMYDFLQTSQGGMNYYMCICPCKGYALSYGSPIEITQCILRTITQSDAIDKGSTYLSVKTINLER